MASAAWVREAMTIAIAGVRRLRLRLWVRAAITSSAERAAMMCTMEES